MYISYKRHNGHNRIGVEWLWLESTVDRGFEPRSGQTIDNVSGWGEMSIRGLLFQ